MEVIESTAQALMDATPSIKPTATKKHIRGSSLLLVGRFISLGLNLVVQVLTVRYLSKSDYGAFAYAVSIASLGSSLAVFGLDKTVTRFVPIYQERKAYDKMFGTIIMMLGTIAGLGLIMVLLVFGLKDLIAGTYIKDQLSVALLLILIVFAPIDALDSLYEGMFAVFASPKAIFFRRHVLGPGLKLIAVIAVIIAHSNVYWLAVGYVIAGVLGFASYVMMLSGLLRRQGLLDHFNLKTIQMPFREIFGFSIPLLSNDFVYMLRSYLPVMLLEYFNSSIGVAAFRAVVPVARLNMLVYQSFTFLYMPLASRMFARNERKGINDLYWQSAVWIAIISFPVFAVSCSLATPLTVLLFGGRYADSGIILALLSLGNYVNAAFGFNTFTLRVYGKVRYIVGQDLLSVIVGIGSSLWLIPHYGALGAAVSTSLTMIAQNFFCQIGLRFGTDVKPFDWAYLKTYVSIGLGGLGLFLVQWLLAPPVYVSFPLAMIVSLLVFILNRNELNVEQIFPELLRFPLMKQILVPSSTQKTV
jgi:O-antigen/teichoic acid export membrane protein